MAVNSVTLRILGDPKDATAKMDKVLGQFDKLKATFDRSALNLDLDDKVAVAKMHSIGTRLERLGEQIARPTVDVRGIDKSLGKVLALDVALDKINGKDATADLNVNRRGGILGKLGDLVNSGSSSGESAGGGLGGVLKIGGIAGAAALAASLLPALVPLALGALAGGGALFGALKTSRGKAAGKDILSNLKGTLKSSLFENQLTDSGKRIPGTSVLDGILGILHQINGFINQMGPQLGGMFRASLPFISSFVKIFEQFAKAVMPAVTQSMRAFTPYLPQIVKGFQALSQGVAGFIKDLGPGMKNSAVVFKAVMIGVKGIMIGLAYTSDALAWAFRRLGHNTLEIAHHLAQWWNDAASWTRSAWDRMVSAVSGAVSRILAFARRIPSDIRSMFSNAGSWLVSAGENIISGLISGIESKVGSLISTIGNIAGTIRDHFPFSPAKRGPLSGSGSPEIAGRKIGQMLAAGITLGGPQVANAASGLAEHVSRSYGVGARNANAHAGTSAQPLEITLNITGNDRDLISLLAKRVRLAGGDPRIFSSKVVIA